MACWGKRREMERRSRQPGQQRGRAPNDVVDVCNAYSERLKVRGKGRERTMHASKRP